MYKCRLVYDEWKSMLKKHRDGAFEDSDEFKGYVGLLTIDEVSEKQQWTYNGEKFTVCDSGYKWLTIMPKDDYYCITVMMDVDYKICVSYIDMIDDQGIDEDGVPFMIDCYLDLVVYPDGNVVVDDRDELDEALRKKEISQEQYDRTLATSDKLTNGLLADYATFEKFVGERLRFVGNIIFGSMPTDLQQIS